jgi:hypothetical protein
VDWPSFGRTTRSQVAHQVHSIARVQIPDLIAPALALAGLVIATALYFFMVRRRGRDRHVRRADSWDREMSQARAIQRLQHMEKRDRDR